MSIKRSPKIPATHAGKYLKDLLERKGVSITKAAEMLKVNRPHLNNFVNAKVDLTPALAYKLNAFTGVSVDFWMNAQKTYDIHKHYTEATEVTPLESVA